MIDKQVYCKICRRGCLGPVEWFNISILEIPHIGEDIEFLPKKGMSTHGTIYNIIRKYDVDGLTSVYIFIE